MAEKLLDRVDVRTKVNHHHGERVSRAVERDVLRYPCPQTPSPQLGDGAAVVPVSVEHLVFRTPPLAHIPLRLRTDVKVLGGTRLLLREDDSRVVPLLLHLAPPHLLYVALPDARKATEQEGPLQCRVLAVRLRQRLNLVYGQVVPVCLSRPEALDSPQRVVRYNPLLKGLVDAGPHLVEVRHLAVLRQGLVRADDVAEHRLLDPCILVEIFLERLDPLRGNLTERDVRGPLAELLQMLQAAPPVAPVPPAHLSQPLLAHIPVIVQEIRVQPVRRLEAVPPVLHVDEPLAPDGLGQLHRLLVLLPVSPRPLRLDVELQELVVPSSVHVDVEVERLPASRDGTPPQTYRIL